MAVDSFLKLEGIPRESRVAEDPADRSLEPAVSAGFDTKQSCPV